ncbi:MAG: bifunctional UDP-N-acetylglucosamine diphosphorylase/glucosamine-1-phosphate N-acetyltransferase GlmU [Pseudobdellovibrionaceae bacterium]
MKSQTNKEKNRPWTAIIMAAGKGTRMKSPLPKVLHPVAGKPMLAYVVEACRQAGVGDVRVVVGHGLNLVKAVSEPWGVQIHVQAQQLGTADAVKSAQPESIEGNVIILNGDHPLIEADDIRHFIEEFESDQLDLAVVTAELKNAREFGRVVRHKGNLAAIVEAKDASAETLKIREVNTGIYLVKADVLSEFLPKIQNNNSKKEFYLTDLISICLADHQKVSAIKGNKKVSVGVNNQQELARASRLVFRRKARSLMEDGVLMIEPMATFIEDSVEVAAGAVIFPNVYLRGKTKIGPFTSIEPGCHLVDADIGESVQLKAYTYLENCKVHSKASVGPFARLRPETEIGEEAQVGNFVEMKKTKFGKKSKAGHLTYLGDAEIGERVNIGCGTITVNYAVDRKKYKTKIGDDVFVGSDCQILAPLTVGDHAILAAGSTITKDVPARALAVARGKQFVKENYVKVHEKAEEAES